jgi:hypothetical protein
VLNCSSVYSLTSKETGRQTGTFCHLACAVSRQPNSESREEEGNSCQKRPIVVSKETYSESREEKSRWIEADA